MIKFVTIVGARPQFIKAAVLSRLFSQTNDIQEVLIHTGQHYDPNMSERFFKELDIQRPNYNLDIHGLSHGAMTGRMLERIESILIEEQPAAVIVYGDTNSTLAGALAAKKLGIEVVHVESGLRSYNMSMPEEINRILTDRISGILFCTSQIGIDTLKREGIEKTSRIMQDVGDIMKDSAMHYAGDIEVDQVQRSGQVVVTLHRAENTDVPDRLQYYIKLINRLSKYYTVQFPIHPRTRHALKRSNLQLDSAVQQKLPVGYVDMLRLIKRSDFVLTDSGGLQKEAYYCGRYCYTMRDETEWTELITSNFNQLIMPTHDQNDIVRSMLHRSKVGDHDVGDKTLYGQGDAGQTMYEVLLATYS